MTPQRRRAVVPGLPAVAALDFRHGGVLGSYHGIFRLILNKKGRDWLRIWDTETRTKANRENRDSESKSEIERERDRDREREREREKERARERERERVRERENDRRASERGLVIECVSE